MENLFWVCEKYKQTLCVPLMLTGYYITLFRKYCQKNLFLTLDTGTRTPMD